MARAVAGGCLGGSLLWVRGGANLRQKREEGKRQAHRVVQRRERTRPHDEGKAVADPVAELVLLLGACVQRCLQTLQELLSAPPCGRPQGVSWRSLV